MRGAGGDSVTIVGLETARARRNRGRAPGVRQVSGISSMEISLPQAAHLLGIPEQTVRRWARQGKLPALESEHTFVFRRSELERWARRHGITLVERPARSEDEAPAEPSLPVALERGGFLRDIPGDDVPSVLEATVARMPLPPEADREDLLERLLQREELASTGVGHGIALPHPRVPVEWAPPEGMVTVCRLAGEVDFQALDGRPVSILFVMLSRGAPFHLKLLSQLSFHLRDESFLAFLRRLESIEELIAEVTRRHDRLGGGRGTAP